MNLHEYQAKKILKKYGIPVPEFGVASSVEEAKRIADELHLTQAVLKIQVHAGGRGKAGGVKFAKNKEEIAQVAKALIGMKMRPGAIALRRHRDWQDQPGREGGLGRLQWHCGRAR